MADAISLVSAVYALTQAALHGLELVVEFYKAPAEVKALLEQVGSFRKIVQCIDAVTNSQPNTIITRAIRRVKEPLEELIQLINTKLIIHGPSTDGVRRLAWLIHKARLVTLRQRLQEAREELDEAINAVLLISTSEMNSTLNILSFELGHTKSTTDSVHQRLSNIESMLGYSITEFGGQDFGRMTSDKGTPAMITGPTMHTSNRFRENSSSQEGDAPAACEPFQRLAPTSSFELSPTFLPETYSTLQPTPTLFCYNSFEEQNSPYNRTIHCAMFCARTPRNWIRLTFDITISFTSSYWNLTRSRRINLARQRYWDLPMRINVALQEFVNTCDDLQSDCHLNIFLGDQLSHTPIEIGKSPRFDVQEYLQHISNKMKHWACPHFYERQLIQRPLLRYRPGKYFASFLQSRWTMENRFGSNQQEIDASFYILSVLHALNGKRGINPLIGIVLDDNKSTANAFLYELPTKGDIFQIINEARNMGELIPWHRREKWCYQIIEGVAEIHSQGFVLGCLGENLDHGIYVNADDNAVHTNQFRRMFTCDRTLSAVLPPEYHHTPLNPGSRNRQIMATPESDLYQLGLLLWRIASHRPFNLGAQFCSKANCATKPGTLCNEPHTYAVQLPCPGEEVSQYLKHIITACRMELPRQRTPAWKLLSMFPHYTQHEQKSTTGQQGDRYMTVLDSGLETRCEVICDSCHTLIPQRFFQCNFCNSNDFDLCPDCLAQGAHCFVTDHYLRERYVGDTKKTGGTEETYYSSEKENGERIVVTC